MSDVDLQNCCDNPLGKMDFSKMSLPFSDINWMDANLWLALFFIVFNPIFWILVARREHQHFTLSYWIGSRRLAFVIFAWTIILLATVRNWRFLVCLRSQPKWSVLQENWILWLGHVLVVSGLILLIASFVSLGFAGAFLGDYFGLLSRRLSVQVAYSIFCWSSAAIAVGSSLVSATQAGLLLSSLLIIMYSMDIWFHGPFLENVRLQRRPCKATQTQMYGESTFDNQSAEPSAADKKKS